MYVLTVLKLKMSTSKPPDNKLLLRYLIISVLRILSMKSYQYMIDTRVCFGTILYLQFNSIKSIIRIYPLSNARDRFKWPPDQQKIFLKSTIKLMIERSSKSLQSLSLLALVSLTKQTWSNSQLSTVFQAIKFYPSICQKLL